MIIASGRPEDHPTPLPLDASATPGVAAQSGRFPDTAGGSETGPQRDLTGERLSQLAAGEAAAAAAMSAAQAADADRRGRYEAAMRPLGASYGDAMALPEVPEAATGPASGFLYSWPGDEPVPSSTGYVAHGDEPQ